MLIPRRTIGGNIEKNASRTGGKLDRTSSVAPSAHEIRRLGEDLTGKPRETGGGKR